MAIPPGRWHSEAFQILATKADRIIGSTAKELAGLHVETVDDLLRLLPRRYYTGADCSDLAELCPGDEVVVIARVKFARVHRAPNPRNGRDRLEITITDGKTELPVTFFGKRGLVNHWEATLPVGTRGIFAGKVGQFRDRPQLAHPDFVTVNSDGRIIGGAARNYAMGRVAQTSLIGIYPATAKVPTWTIAECAQLALQFVGELADPWPQWVTAAAQLPDIKRAFEYIHRPTTLDEPELGRRRVYFDEAFSVQLAMAQRRLGAARATARPLASRSGQLVEEFTARLPFSLTDGQRRVCAEIGADLIRDHPMQRLLQGEVGSGKTIVALLAMLQAVDAGAQAVLLAPTEVLAAQHYRTITGLLGDLGAGGTLDAGEHATAVRLLTGSMTPQTRRAALLDVASGQAGLIIGTHSVLSTDVHFAELGLVVVDEQHRFGVEQRAALNDRAECRPHVLVMTATPIPRSVAMTVFGDLSVSNLTELPQGRAEVTTTVVDTKAKPAWVDRAWQRVREEVAAGRQAFVVCPRIGLEDKPKPSSEQGVKGKGIDAAAEGGAAAVEVVEALRRGPLAGLRLGLLHGQLSAAEKDQAMSDFVAGETDVLVATTVIEVGVDVANASMMVILDADRFGVSQLHQLRGRVGRGQHRGVCLLFTAVEPPLRGAPANARDRLDAVAATRDGFVLAEVDLQQRREGDVLGSTQAGHRSRLRLLSVIEHAELIAQAREIAEQAIAQDPGLTTAGFADAVAMINQLADDDWADGG